MNSVFEINRFVKLFIREFDRYKTKLMWIAISAFGIFALGVVCNYLFDREVFRFPFVSFAYTLIVLAPLIFYKGLDRINSVFDFTLPASSFEKFLVKFCFSIVLMPVFALALLSIIALLYKIMPGGMGVDAATRIFESFRDWSWDGILLIYGFQSFFFVGVFYFRKNVFWKVTACLLIYFILLGFVFIMAHHNLLSNHNGASVQVNTFNVQVSGSSAQLSQLLEESNPIIFFTMTAIVPFGMWLVAYLRSRENEI